MQCIRLLPNWLDEDFTTQLVDFHSISEEDYEALLIGVTYALAILQRVIKEGILIPNRNQEAAAAVISLKKELRNSQNLLNASGKWTPKIAALNDQVAKFTRHQCVSMAQKLLVGYP